MLLAPSLIPGMYPSCEDINYWWGGGEKKSLFVVNPMSQTPPCLLTVLIASVKVSKIKITFLSKRGNSPQHNLYKNLKFLEDSIAQMNQTNVGAKGKYTQNYRTLEQESGQGLDWKHG